MFLGTCMRMPFKRMQQRTTAEVMRLRGSTVEHPFAAIKYRIFGHPRFLLRGLAGAQREISLATLVYNLKRMLNVLAGCGKTRFDADAVPRNSLVSTARPDKKKACAEETSNSWMCSVTSAPSGEFRTITPC